MSSRPKDRTSMLLGFLVAGCVAMVIVSALVVFWQVFKLRSALLSCVAVVQHIATAVDVYPTRTWTWSASDGSRRTELLWDLNHDGLIDGLPAVTASATADGGFTPEVIASGYVGLHGLIRPTIASRFISKNYQILDSWGHPLRIAFAEKVYGAAWFGIWSAGQDGIDGTADDVKSWR